MRAKYKIGTLVELGDRTIGIIDRIITTGSGFEYVFTGCELTNTFREADILKAYRPIEPRKPRTSNPKTKKEKKAA